MFLSQSREGRVPYFQIDEFKDIGHPANYYIDRDVIFDGRGEVHISPLFSMGR
jgi:hypothetical protein